MSEAISGAAPRELFDFKLRRVVQDDLGPPFIVLHRAGDSHDFAGQRFRIWKLTRVVFEDDAGARLVWEAAAHVDEGHAGAGVDVDLADGALDGHGFADVLRAIVRPNDHLGEAGRRSHGKYQSKNECAHAFASAAAEIIASVCRAGYARFRIPTIS